MLTIKRLSIDDAKILIDGTRARAAEIGIPMCIAITDESGVLIAFERMDGGKVTSTAIAQDKAFTAAGARKATHEYAAVAQPGMVAFGIDSECSGRLSIIAGGLPVTVDGDVVGGIGVSSGTPPQDQDCAQAGIDHFLKVIGK